MAWHDFLVFLHILLFVFWIGTDVGVFVLGKFAQDPDYTPPERSLMIKIAMILDMFPRLAVPLFGSLGFQLAYNLQLTSFSPIVMAAVWAFGAFWLAVVVIGLKSFGTPRQLVTQKIERVIHILLVVGLCGAGIYGLVTGELIEGGWLASKVLLFGLLFVCFILLEESFKPAIMGFMALEAGEQSEVGDATIRAAMDRTYIWVTGIYIIALSCAFLGTVKPDWF